MRKILKFAFIFITALISLAILAGSIFAYHKYAEIVADLPDCSNIAGFHPNEATMAYDRNGVLLAEFYREKRYPVSLSQMTEEFKNAVIATEGRRFYQHYGIDFKGIARAAKRNIAAGRIVEGASTITQQLTRWVYLSPKQTFTRKIREMVLALEIEERISKDRILELYLNLIYYGAGAYGIEAAAQTYFSKHAWEINVSEAALLAGLPQAPSSYDPRRHPERAKKRRNAVLDNMVEVGYLEPKEADRLKKEPILLNPKKSQRNKAPYFIEYVRQELIRTYGEDVVYGGGLRVYTTIDYKLQEAAEKAVKKGLRELDKRQGFRGPLPPGDYKKRMKVPADGLKVGDRLVAAISRIEKPGKKKKKSKGKRTIHVKMGESEALLDRETASWAKWEDKSYYETAAREKDLILVEVVSITKRDNNAPEIVVSLEQEPKTEGALLSMDVHTGEILAWVGGYEFNRSQFNRVYQAKRQPGSGFKPIIYSAALDEMFTPGDIIYDTPIIRDKGADAGFNRDLLKALAADNQAEDAKSLDELRRERYWKPANYSHKFYGPTTLRSGLVHSRNLVTIRLLDELGVRKAVAFARSLGIARPLDANLTLALGTSVVSLTDMLPVYCSFAALGMRPEPWSIDHVLDRNGKRLAENSPIIYRTMRKQTAYLISSMLQDVVQQGTGVRARRLGRPLAGKTGTTNEYIDAWFFGYSPRIAAAVWVGFDNISSLGRGEAGSKAALPIWIDYMKTALKDQPVEEFPNLEEGIVEVAIDKETGLLATDQCKEIIVESYREGTQPTQFSEASMVRRDRFLSADFDALDPDEADLPPDENRFLYSSD